ncbi:MAG: thiamine-phosphate pyrophosphorylase [Sulfurospirillaceae bacterium]|nr:thiamine-phosphate pyrophosphorylase [Sulfurospirillaceae bacterium]MDD3463148.1 thiamine-phosphate pyrophosphorylase [Sulfurospirillaceae bacterium]
MTNKEQGITSPEIYRIVDANLNRLREGIRVVEDICRYLNNDEKLSKALKELRHKARVPNYKDFLTCRDVQTDPLKQTTQSEKKRSNIESIILSNIKRAQESARVLEEVLKLQNTEQAELFKQIRYELYDLEKKILLEDKEG